MTASRQPLVPAGKARTELIIKKSRFIASAGHATSRAEAMAFLQHVRDDYPDARHHCWAYLLGDPQATASAGMNDDGEPSGTAGKPILNVIQHKGIGNVMVSVTRYFGGIKLGAGGLARAYAGATENVLSKLPLSRHAPHSKRRLQADFAHEQAIRHWCTQHDARIAEVVYSTRVILNLTVADTDLAALAAFCDARSITHLDG